MPSPVCESRRVADVFEWPSLPDTPISMAARNRTTSEERYDQERQHRRGRSGHRHARSWSRTRSCTRSLGISLAESARWSGRSRSLSPGRMGSPMAFFDEHAALDEDVILDYMDDITASWGRHQTLEQMRTSRYFTQINIPVNPRRSEQWRIQNARYDALHNPTASPGGSQAVDHVDAITQSSTVSFTFSSVHPIPHRYLRHLTPDQLRFLGEFLQDEMWECEEGAEELLDRMSETLFRVADLLAERGLWGCAFMRGVVRSRICMNAERAEVHEECERVESDGVPERSVSQSD